MARLNGQVERQLVTALLLVALLVSCGVAGGARRAPGSPEPAATGAEPATATATPALAAIPAPALAGTPGTPVAAEPSAAPQVAASAPASTPMPARPPSTSPLATHRLVTYYGHPYSDKMGILGEYDPEEMVARLKEQAAAYTAVDPSRPALCTIELIASMATSEPGNDGLWLLRLPTAKIEQYAQLAERQGCLLLLDVQMGLDTVENDVAALLPFLRRPYVHLAIDPEFKVKPGQVPGEHYGSVSAAEVTWAMRTLGDLVRESGLPDKVLVVHQFRDDMLPDKENIRPLPNVDLVIMMDGWGGTESKVGNYNYFVGEQLIQYGGIKLFYRQDDPLLAPEEVVQLEPAPLVVIYQ